MLCSRYLELTHLASLYAAYTNRSPRAPSAWHRYCVLASESLAVIDFIREIMQNLSFCVGLISLSILFSKSIHVAANDRIYFFFLLLNTMFCFVCFLFDSRLCVTSGDRECNVNVCMKANGTPVLFKKYAFYHVLFSKQIMGLSFMPHPSGAGIPLDNL